MIICSAAFSLAADRAVSQPDSSVIDTSDWEAVSQPADSSFASDAPGIGVADSAGSNAETTKSNSTRVDTASTETLARGRFVRDSLLKSLDTAAEAPDSFDLHHGVLLGGGIGMSLGSSVPMSLWREGLPAGLDDFGLSPSFMSEGADTLPLQFMVRKKSDEYNLLFPVSLSFWRLSPASRYGAAFSFTANGKSRLSSIVAGSDTLGRSLTIEQSIGLYVLRVELLYGRSISQRLFSIDGSDRTDVILGLTASPFVALRRKTEVSASASDPRLSAVRDAVASSSPALSASGVSVGWRLGLVTLRHLSGRGLIETSVSYAGSYAMRFTANGNPVLRGDINPAGESPAEEISYSSSRVDISISILRHIGTGRHEPHP